MCLHTCALALTTVIHKHNGKLISCQRAFLLPFSLFYLPRFVSDIRCNVVVFFLPHLFLSIIFRPSRAYLFFFFFYFSNVHRSKIKTIFRSSSIFAQRIIDTKVKRWQWQAEHIPTHAHICTYNVLQELTLMNAISFKMDCII